MQFPGLERFTIVRNSEHEGSTNQSGKRYNNMPEGSQISQVATEYVDQERGRESDDEMEY